MSAFQVTFSNLPNIFAELRFPPVGTTVAPIRKRRIDVAACKPGKKI